jgi:hypothetical protein
MPTTPTPNDHALMALLNPAPIIMCVGLALDLDEQMQMNREHLQTTIHNEVHNNRRRRRRRRNPNDNEENNEAKRKKKDWDHERAYRCVVNAADVVDICRVLGS